MKPMRWAMPAALILAVACSDPGGPLPSLPGGGRLELVVSDLAAPTGARVVVAVRADDRPAALQGWLRYDPRALRYVGQPAVWPAALVGVDTAAGRLHVAAVQVGGLPETVVTLVFEVTSEGYDRGIAFEAERVAGPDLARWRSLEHRVHPRTDAGLVVPPNPRRLALADWMAIAPRAARSGGPLRLPGDGSTFGEVILDGGIDVFDVLGIENVSAAVFPLLTRLADDYAIAGDVFPYNSPGLGEDSDANPPGLEPDGSHEVDVFDALAVATYVAGIPVPVVGQPIPGRAPRAGAAVLSGVITANRTLTKDTVYRLSGHVIVSGPGVTLTIQAGTRIEADPATRAALSVRFGALINAQGTRLEPIVMTCGASAPAPGCWGGLTINGASLINNGPFGGGLVGCPQKLEEGGGIFGGCLVQHSSGTLQYVRIEFAGAPWPGHASPAAAVALNGVGSGTLIEYLQVREASGDGVGIAGGTAQVRQLLITRAAARGLSWTDGWRGKLQSLIVYRSQGTGPAIEGDNAATDPLAAPRSHPTIYNVTISEDGVAGGAGYPPAILFRHGSGGVVADVIVAGWRGLAVDIADPETCARVAADSLEIHHGIFFGNRGGDFATDPDCIDEVAYGQAGPRANLFTDPLLLDPRTTLSPDLRPAGGSPAEIGMAPPADGFFDVPRAFRGAVPTGGNGKVPWYAGWTVGY